MRRDEVTTKLDQGTVPADEVPAHSTLPRGAPKHGAPTTSTDAVVDQPEGRPRGSSGWLAVTTLGVVVVAGVGAATTARVGAIALVVLVVGCAVVRATVRPGPAALSVRSRRTDVLVLCLLAAALAAVATQLPAS